MRRSMHHKQPVRTATRSQLSQVTSAARQALPFTRNVSFLVDPINGQVAPQALADPNGILANSNHTTGPPSSVPSSTAIDHKMVPAAIGSERKRHAPPPAVSGTMNMNSAADWSSVAKRAYNDTYSPANRSLCSVFRSIHRRSTPAASSTSAN